MDEAPSHAWSIGHDSIYRICSHQWCVDVDARGPFCGISLCVARPFCIREKRTRRICAPHMGEGLRLGYG